MPTRAVSRMARNCCSLARSASSVRWRSATSWRSARVRSSTAISMRLARPVTTSSSAPSSDAAASPSTENSQALACCDSADLVGLGIEAQLPFASGEGQHPVVREPAA